MLTDADRPRLLPCPFCGDDLNEYDDGSLFIATQGTKWGIVNHSCWEVRTGYGPIAEWRDDAIEEWNKRVTDAD